MMGIISDYLEYNRDNIRENDFDPVMWSWHRKNNKVVVKSRSNLSIYKKQHSQKIEKQIIVQNLIENYKELYQSKICYIITEKFLLELLNKYKWHTVFVENILNSYKKDVNESYISVCEMIYDINEIVSCEKYENNVEINEKELKINLLDNVTNSILVVLKNDNSEEADSSFFRKIVKDLNIIIRCLKNGDTKTSPKQNVEKYLTEKGIKKSHYICRNCGNYLYENIDYCITCYERNF